MTPSRESNSVSPLEELFERVLVALDEAMAARSGDVDTREAAVEAYRQEWRELTSSRDWWEVDEIREAGDWRIRLSRRYVPKGWAHVSLYALDGQLFWSGLAEDRDLSLEIVVQIERARRFNRDAEAHR